CVVVGHSFVAVPPHWCVADSPQGRRLRIPFQSAKHAVSRQRPARSDARRPPLRLLPPLRATARGRDGLTCRDRVLERRARAFAGRGQATHPRARRAGGRHVRAQSEVRALATAVSSRWTWSVGLTDGGTVSELLLVAYEDELP